MAAASIDESKSTTTMIEGDGEQEQQEFEHILVTSNLSKKGNVGTLVRACVAFSTSELLLVGNNRFATHGAHGSQKHMRVVCATNWREAEKYLHLKRNCEIVGIVPSGALSFSDNNQRKLLSQPIPIHERQFNKKTAFILALRSDEINEISNICDKLMFIPQRTTTTPPGATTSSMPICPLEASTVACIVLQHFASWAKFNERSTSGYKYDLDSNVVQGQWRVKKGVADIIDVVEEESSTTENNKGEGGGGVTDRLLSASVRSSPLEGEDVTDITSDITCDTDTSTVVKKMKTSE
jgi:hypothetical protein